MDWNDEGLVIGARRHGEASVILEVMTRDHGRHLGLVRNGRSRAMQPVMQAGNSVNLAWRARLSEHLGTFVVEGMQSRSAQLISGALALHGIGHLCALLRLLPERDSHADLYAMAVAIADHLDDANLGPQLLVRFEMAMLVALGFGLDVEKCAATGTHDDLIYVSPKSGRAVSRAAGAPYADRLLPLPAFLQAPADMEQPVAQVLAGFALTGHFLTRDVAGPRGPDIFASRAALIAFLGKTDVI